MDKRQAAAEAAGKSVKKRKQDTYLFSNCALYILVKESQKASFISTCIPRFSFILRVA